jgi:hypothetical protein
MQKDRQSAERTEAAPLRPLAHGLGSQAERGSAEIARARRIGALGRLRFRTVKRHGGSPMRGDEQA